MRPISPDSLQSLWQHFDRLSMLPEDEQAGRLAQLDLDPDLTAELARLLAGGRLQGVLDAPLPDSADPRIEPSLPDGTIVGRFRLAGLIGRGGAGEVYLAHRAAGGFDQSVALKLLRREAVARLDQFDAERALQATLEHPGIARLIDGGEAPDGRPFMVLEYVDGRSITTWCAARRLDVRERLRLFLEVCEAVTYAHARLIVHCDLKPGNILVGHDGRVKLLDFGIAKVLTTGQGETALAGMLLTPGYAAPEQLAGRPATIATDVYSLGAVLFELLTGVPLWRPRPAPLIAMLRGFEEGSSIRPSDAARSAANPPVKARRLSGDLDAIVHKAMRPDPERRYESVSSLAEDVRRHLMLQAVSVRATSRRYRLRRFVRRHWLAVGTSALALVSIIAGTAGVAWQAHRALVERDAARDNAARLQAANQVMLLMFRDVGDSAQLRSISVREMLDGTTSRILNSLPAGSPDAAPTVVALADIYLILENNADAERLLEGALARGIGKNDPANLARLKLKLGTVLAFQGQLAAADQLIAEADSMWQSDPVRYRRERVESAGAHAAVLRRRGALDQAITLLQTNMADAEQVYAGDDGNLSARYSSVAALLAEAGRPESAAQLLDKARDQFAVAGNPPAGASLNLLRLRAELSNQLGKPAQAETTLRSIVADRRKYYGPSIALAVDLLHLARLQIQRGNSAAALESLAQAEPMADEHFGKGSQPSLQIKLAQVWALAMLEDAPQARRLFSTLPADRFSPDAAGSPAARYLNTRAALFFAEGNPLSARADLARAISVASDLGFGSISVRREVEATEARWREKK